MVYSSDANNLLRSGVYEKVDVEGTVWTSYTCQGALSSLSKNAQMMKLPPSGKISYNAGLNAVKKSNYKLALSSNTETMDYTM